MPRKKKEILGIDEADFDSVEKIQYEESERVNAEEGHFDSEEEDIYSGQREILAEYNDAVSSDNEDELQNSETHDDVVDSVCEKEEAVVSTQDEVIANEPTATHKSAMRPNNRYSPAKRADGFPEESKKYGSESVKNIGYGDTVFAIEGRMKRNALRKNSAVRKRI